MNDTWELAKINKYLIYSSKNNQQIKTSVAWELTIPEIILSLTAILIFNGKGW
jgi:hypothetical protein